MTSVKKPYEELYAFLLDNKRKKIATVMPELLEIMARKKNSSGSANTHLKNDKGEVYAIYCYYHKKWELLSDVEYGKKANSTTGLNTMCKEGTSHWYKQRRNKDKAEKEMLAMLSNGDLLPTDIANEQKRIEEESKIIVPRDDGHGYIDVEEVKEVYSNNVNEEL